MVVTFTRLINYIIPIITMTKFKLYARVSLDAPNSVESTIVDQIREHTLRSILALRIPKGIEPSWNDHYAIYGQKESSRLREDLDLDFVGRVTNLGDLADRLYDIFRGSKVPREVRVISSVQRKNVRDVYSK